MIYHNIYTNTDLSKIKNVSIILCIKCLDQKYRILVGQLKDNKWTAPGGRVESYEKDTDIGLFIAMQREFEEETGYKLNNISMCYDEYFIFDRIHTNESITRIYMNCTNIDNFIYYYNQKIYEINFGSSKKKDKEMKSLACYSLDTILKNTTKYQKYFINGLNNIKDFAEKLNSNIPKDQLILECGFIEKKSSPRYKYFENITLSKDGWTKVDIIYNNEIINTKINNNTVITYELIMGDNDIFNLNENDKLIFSRKYVFTVKLHIYGIDSKKFKYDIGYTTYTGD
jgi:8-oxo-dGTP pyrophosphatase MutT (NUDIX family)